MSHQTMSERKMKARPNYFVAIQVNDPQIVSAAMEIQAGIQSASGQDLSTLKIAPETFHITLMVMNLANQEEIDRAAQSLKRCQPVTVTKELLGDQHLSLEFEKLSVFGGGRVVFACAKKQGEEILQLMSDEVKRKMKENGVESKDAEDKPFIPHLTLFKYKWKPSKSAKKSPKKIETSWYEAFDQQYLGSQRINSLQLCSMDDDKRDDGYYFVNYEVPILPEI